MPLDPDTQYYALDPADAGAQPAAAPDPAVDPGMAADADLSGPLMAAPPTVQPSMLALIQQLSGKSTGNGKGSKAAPLVPAAGSTAKLASTLSPVVQAAAAQLMSNPSQAGMPQLAADPPAVSEPPAPSPTDAAGNSIPAAPAAAPPGPAPLTMPQMPKHNDTALQIIGTLAALAGGSGGKVLGAYADARNAHDVQTYNQQVQAYQQQQHDNQQQVDNQTQQSANMSQLVDRLAKIDPASQEAQVKGLLQSPGMLASYGTSAQALRTEFYGADGKFIPVGAADKPDNPQALARAQTAARNSMQHMTTQGQQAYHDSFANDTDAWVQQTGLPYEGFTPSETQRDTIQAGTLAEKVANDAVTGAAKTSDAQNAALKTFRAMTPALQAAMIQSYASHPSDAETKYGIPYGALKPGMTQADATAALGVANREQDATRTASNAVNIAKLNIAARGEIAHANNQVTMRGQDLRAQLEGKAINTRVAMFNQRYGAGSGGAAEKQYQSLIKQRQAIQTEMTKLSAPQKDAFGEPTLSQRDIGRIDADGNIVKNPVPTAAYNEYMQLQSYDQQLQQQMNAMTRPAMQAAQVQFGGGPMRPAPVTINGKTLLPRTLLPRTSPLSGPPAPPLSGSGIATLRAQARQPARAAAPAPLTPAQIHGMTTPQLLQRLAAKMQRK